MPAPPPDSDETLALEAQAGSRVAFEQLVERFGERVLVVLERRVGDHHAALDLTQDAWVRVFRALPRYAKGHSFRSWLFSIVLNGARDERRRQQRSRLEYVDLQANPDATAPKAKSQASQDETRSIERALQTVAEPFRTALILVDIEGLSYEECGTALKIATGTAKSRVYRGRRAFQEAYLRPKHGATPPMRIKLQP